MTWTLRIEATARGAPEAEAMTAQRDLAHETRAEFCQRHHT